MALYMAVIATLAFLNALPVLAIAFSNSSIASPASSSTLAFLGPLPYITGVDEFSSFLSYSDASYRRSPQCTADFKSFSKDHPIVTTTDQLLYVDWSSPSGGSYHPYTTETIPISPSAGPPKLGCCASCNVWFGSVDFRYFLAEGANTSCIQSTTSQFMTSSVNTSVPNFQTTAMVPTTVSAGPVISVGPDNFTYTSPSVYLVFGTVGAWDGCGQIGSHYSNVTLSYLPEQLTVLADERSPGNNQPLQLNPAWFPCAPQSMHSWFQYYYNGGDRPFMPYFSAPPELLKLDPAFSSRNCTIYSGGVYDQAGWDPPVMLTPQAQLATPITTTAPETTVDAQPANLPSTFPTPTSMFQPSKQPSVQASAVPNTQGSSPNQPSSKDQPQDPLPTSAPTPATFTPGSGADPGDQPLISIGDHTLTPIAGGIIVAGQTLTGDVSIVTLDGTPINVATLVDPVRQPLVSLGGYTLSAVAGGYIVAGQTLTAGASAITVDGTPMSLVAPSANIPGYVLISSQAYPILPAPTTKPVFTAAGKTFTVDSAGLVIDGSTVQPGHAYTVAPGSVISLQTDGAVVMGSSTLGVETVPTGGPGIGGAIWSAFGGSAPAGDGGASSTTGTNGSIAQFTGSATKARLNAWFLLWLIPPIAAVA